MSIYLDNAATAKYIKNRDDVIIEAIIESMKTSWQNPSSSYFSSQSVKKIINKCRENISKFIGAESEEIIFTSGASESNNQAIRGWADEVWLKTYKTPYIISTSIEHKSIIKLLEESNLDASTMFCAVDKFGIIDYKSLERQLLISRNMPVLVTVGMANNEIGTIQDIRKISDIVHKYNSILHVDATQVFGKIPIDVKELGIDMMSVSGHKISPVLKGIGFLYKKNNINIQPLIYGTQENGYRGGTENTFGIIGLSKAVELCDINQEKIEEFCKKRDYFYDLLESKFGCKLNGHPINRLPNNINITFSQEITGESLLYTLDLEAIQVSTGSACNSQAIEPSHVLKAIGLTNDEAARTIRISIPDNITYEEIDFVVNEIDKAIQLIELC